MFCQFLYESRFKIDGPGGNRGFNLIELGIAVAIIGIIGTIGAPPLLRMRTNIRTRGVASDIFSSFRHAQSVAVKQNTSVCLEFNQVAGTYKAFLDNGAISDNCIQDADEPTTLFTKRVVPGTSLFAVNFPPNPATAVGFSSRGRPYNGIGSVEVQNNSIPNLRYRISLSLAGRADIKVTTNGGGTWK